LIKQTLLDRHPGLWSAPIAVLALSALLRSNLLKLSLSAAVFGFFTEPLLFGFIYLAHGNQAFRDRFLAL